MTFKEDLIWDFAANGARYGTGHNTAMLPSKGGTITRVARWDGAVRQFDVPVGPMDDSRAAELENFILAVEGGLHGFRFLCQSDCSTGPRHYLTPTKDDVNFGTGDGTTTQFQLVKRYTSGSTTKVRNIFKPIDGTVLVAKATTLQTEGTHYTIDYTTGMVTFASAPTLGQQLTWGGMFHVPVHCGPSTDALFAQDFLSILARQVRVDFIEEPSPSIVVDDYPFGGAFELAFSIPTQITPLMGRLGALTPGAATDIILPAASLLPLGGPHFVLANLSGANAITVKSSGSTIGTIGTSTTKHLSVFLISGVNTWRLY